MESLPSYYDRQFKHITAIFASGRRHHNPDWDLKRSRLLGNLKVPEHFKCATDLAFLDMTFREDVMARHHYPEFIAGVVR
jgi:hypothetical protein